MRSKLVAVFVAVMGIAGALLALVIDRRREFGLLRFLGGAAVADPQADPVRGRAARTAGEYRRACRWASCFRCC